MTHHKIILGDCLEGMKLLDDESVDLVLTDPVYQDKRCYEIVGRDLPRVLKNDSPALVVVTHEHLTWQIPLLTAEGLNHVWLFANNLMGIRRFNWKRRLNMQYNLFWWGEKGKSKHNKSWLADINMETKGERSKHKWYKSAFFLRYLVDAFSEPDNTILDLFAGSFTVARTARDLGRNSISMEIDTKNWEEIGKTALKAKTPTLDNSVTFEVINLQEEKVCQKQ